jgi:hypothetical protein
MLPFNYNKRGRKRGIYSLAKWTHPFMTITVEDIHKITEEAAR